MHQIDLHNNIKYVRTISPVAVGTTGTGQTGKIVDRSGYEGVELIVGYGSITATNATLSVTLLEGAATGTMTAVVSSAMIPSAGALAAAGIAAGTPRASGANKNVTHRLGYNGILRYVSANVKSTVTAGTLIHAGFLLGNPHSAPVAS